jgi:hypothetical protein
MRRNLLDDLRADTVEMKEKEEKVIDKEKGRLN